MSKPVTSLAEIIASGRNLLNETEAAAFLDTTIGTLQVWRSTGRYGIPFVKIGRSVRYKRADLEAWVESRTHGSTPPVHESIRFCHDSFDCLACRKKRQRYSPETDGDFKSPEFRIMSNPLSILAYDETTHETIGHKCS